MRAVKKLMEAGLTFPAAVRAALEQRGLDVTQFAERYKLDRIQLSKAINLRLVPSAAQLMALTGELGATPEEWRALWFEKASALRTAIPKDTKAGARRRVG